MRFFTLLVSAVSLAGVASAWDTTAKVTYDEIYDNGQDSLNNVACSNGKNGLESIGFTTFDSLPTFPYIGGAQAVTGWNSTGCGTCWELSYGDKTIHILAVDFAASGFNIAFEAFNDLTGGQGKELGVVEASVKEVSPHVCGL